MVFLCGKAESVGAIKSSCCPEPGSGREEENCTADQRTGYVDPSPSTRTGLVSKTILLESWDRDWSGYDGYCLIRRRFIETLK